MVGEIRDSETAKISIEAALTGHLVLSTMHTNDAPGAISRLNEMGVEPFLTGSAVSAVLAQRLARKLCTHCCEMYSPSVEDMIKARVSPDVAAAQGAWAARAWFSFPYFSRKMKKMNGSPTYPRIYQV